MHLTTYLTTTRALWALLRGYATLCLSVVVLSGWSAATALGGPHSLHTQFVYLCHALLALVVSGIIDIEHRYWQYRKRLANPDADIAMILDDPATQTPSQNK